MSGTVVAVCVSKHKGERKKPVPSAALQQDYGIPGDAHAGPWHRQVSLLAMESIDKIRKLGPNVGAGDFAENITTVGIELMTLPIGTRLAIGASILEITQIGKECHTRCAIYRQAGTCVMPTEGVFARVLQSGVISPNDGIAVTRPAVEAEFHVV